MRLLHPFLRVLRRHAAFPGDMLAPLEAMDIDDRMPIAAVHELLRGGIAMTMNTDIGLEAARDITPGEYGALEYAVSSASTWSDAIAVCGRYMRLVNDALSFVQRHEGDQVVVQLDSSVALPRAAADFQSAALYLGSRRLSSRLGSYPYEVWFTHPRPESIEAYERVFAGGTLRFGAQFNGFVYDRRELAVSLDTADPALHSVIRKHAEQMLAELPRTESTTDKVRDLITKSFERGCPGVGDIARSLHISPRTLGRKLEHEGTTFKELLDDMRHRLARRYVGSSDIAFSEIAFLLGFSQAAAFHRAFKRWTSQTPLEFRRTRRG